MQKLRIGLFGFGRTGKWVAQEILKDEALELAFVVRRSTSSVQTYASTVLELPGERGPVFSWAQLEPALARQAHVLIDFSGERTFRQYTDWISQDGPRVVSAISNYPPEELSAFQQLAEKTAVLHSPNITLGINFLMVAAKAMQKLAPDADVAVVEEHFKDKPDVSGTAQRIAKALDSSVTPIIHSIRAGGIVGRHEVIFGLPNQTVRLIHESIHRAAFGRGAIFAAKWLSRQPPGWYSMENAVREIMANAVLSV